MAQRSHLAPPIRTVFLCLSFIILLFVAGVTRARGQSSSDATLNHDAQPLPSEPTGASRCIICHPAEVEGYARSAMAHSLRRAGQEPVGAVTAHGSKITMHSSATGYWQTRENAGNKSEYRVDYVIGSGNHASGYLVDIGGHLFQSPVAFYTSRQSYDLAPGFENRPDPDFTRPVSVGCVLCHSGTALHIPGTLNQYGSPIFLAEAITCERCHGPAAKHLADPRAGTIINPAKLEPAARDSICEQCHLLGAARVLNPGKEFSDFIPGQRLEDTFTTYHDVMPAGSSAGALKVISHVEQLALSACARNSGGRLWCGTCHDPHDKPLQALQYYRARCLTCHTASFPPSHPTKDSDCLGCHMPRRNAQDGGHTVFTDHRIQRRPAPQHDLPPNTGIAAWREPSPEFQKRNLGIAYIDAGMQRHSSPFVVQGYRTLTEVQRQFTKDSDFFEWIGEALLLAEKTSQAKFALERALQLDPNSALNEANAASPYIQAGDLGRATAHLQRAITLDPLYLSAASTLIDLYKKEGKTMEAAELSDKIKLAMSEKPGSGKAEGNSAEGDPPKRTEEVFKNIQVLKGVSADELIPAMEFISSSLGVECSFCHVEDHFEKDDKKPKQTARGMMKMMFALNKNSFDGHREVTCYSCHRGARDPVSTPVVENETLPHSHPADTEAAKLAAHLPAASELIENYVKALGGAAALEKINTRIQKGTESLNAESVRVEIFTEAPFQQSLVRHLPQGDSVTVFDGHTAWFAIPGRPARALHGEDLEAVRTDADLHFPLHIRELYPEVHVEYPEKIGERDAYVLFCIRKTQPPTKLYFDQQSGLLVRILRYAESPLGLDPQQLDYADYRDVDGVQVPFRVTVSQPGSTSTIRIDEVKQNVPIDRKRFSRPTL